MSDTEEAILQTIEKMEKEDKKKRKKPIKRTLKNRKRDEKKFILSEETAEEQLILFLDFYEIYEDDLGSQAEKDALETASNKIKIAIRKGQLTFKENGTFTQTLNNKSKIEYEILSGAAKVQNKARKDESEDAMRTNRLYAMMGSLAGLEAENMKKFKAIDLSVMECVGFLLSTV